MTMLKVYAVARDGRAQLCCWLKDVMDDCTADIHIPSVLATPELLGKHFLSNVAWTLTVLEPGELLPPYPRQYIAVEDKGDIADYYKN